jgi:ATP-binding cassette subfamily C protein
LNDVLQVLHWIDTRLRLRWALLVPVMCAAAIVEAMAALALFGALRLVFEPHRVRTAPLVSQVWQAWPTDDPPAVLAAVIGGVAALYVARALFLGWAEWFKESTIARSAARAAERLFTAYLSADYAFHLRRRSSALIQEVARSTDIAFQLVAGSMVNILAESATIVALAVVIAFAAPMAVISAIGVVIALVAVPILATRRMWNRFGARQTTLEQQQLHVLQQSLGAVKEVRITRSEPFFAARFAAVRRGLNEVIRRRAWIATVLRLAVETTLILCMLAVVLVVIRRGITGAETLAVLALFAYTGFRVVPSANRIMLNAGYLREGRAFIHHAVEDFRTMTGAPAARPSAEHAPVTFERSLTLEGVSFAYDAQAAQVLHDVDLVLRRGESVGIVGPTGAGKSTLVDVLLGLLQPTAGRVLVDGEDLRGRERTWQQQIGYVPQTPALLDDSVRRNIAFGIPDASIDEQRVARACALAQLEDVLRMLPEGLDTVVGERGVRLSGGQRQRVAIARALYRDPQVIVFDEATGALDSATDREVSAAVAALHGGRTVIVIAHRLSTVSGCDRLIVVREGRIAATGTVAELMADRSFRAMTSPDAPLTD